MYDGYRPQNLAQSRDYIDFLIRENPKQSVATETNTPQHILDYLSQEIRTRLPDEISEHKILEFDQNFECGNLDSAYL